MASSQPGIPQSEQSPEKYKKKGKEDEKLAKQREQKMAALRRKTLNPIQMQPIFMERQKVMDALPNLCAKQDYELRKTEVRNVLFVGKSRSGKSTVIRTLRGVENSIDALTLFSETKEVQFRNFALQSKDPHEKDYTFNIIDTPGLFEVKRAGQKARTDEEILNMISDCLKNEITRLHLIILFCSITAGVDNSDVLAMKKLIETFGVDTNMAICITRSENSSPADRGKILGELEQHAEVGDLIQQVKKNVFFMGAVDPERASEHTLQKMVDRVVEDRANLLQFIFYCDNDTKIEELKFVDDKRIEIKKKKNPIGTKSSNCSIRE